MIEEDIAKRRPWRPTSVGYLGQLQAIVAWECYSRLDQISAPTLVIHGKNDRLVPPGNGEIIASRILGAQLVLIENAGHLFSTDQPAIAHAAVLRFLSSQPG